MFQLPAPRTNAEVLFEVVQPLEQAPGRNVNRCPDAHHDGCFQEGARPICARWLGEKVMWHSKNFREPAKQDDQAEGERFDPEDDFPLLDFCQVRT
jgi:hypothetical protein